MSNIPRKLFALLVIVLVGVPATAQMPPPATQDVTPRVDKLFEKWDRTDSPGCALSVMQDGHIVYSHGYGMADLDHNVTITPSTVFHVASMSKQFTAASIILLEEQGKLKLDDDIRKYLPEVPDFGTPITIRELLHHTSGLRDQWDLLDLAGWRYSLDLITDDDVMSLVKGQKDLNFKPGEKELYSNTGYTVLGQIVKRVSGTSLREVTTKNIFEPLGMTNTHFRDDHAEIVKNNAYGYQPDKDGRFRLSLTNFDNVGPTSLHTTVEDLALWDENFYQPRVGGPDLVAQMLERGKLNSGEQLDYASGLMLGKYRGLTIIDHPGSDAGYRAEMARFPEQHFSVAVLCNSSDTNPSILARSVADIYLAKQMEPVVPTPPALQLTREQLASVAGLYWNRDEDQFVNVQMKADKLHFTQGVDDDFVLKPVSEAHFHIADVSWGNDENVVFLQATQDKPRRLSDSFRDGKPTVYEFVEKFEPKLGDLSE